MGGLRVLCLFLLISRGYTLTVTVQGNDTGKAEAKAPVPQALKHVSDGEMKEMCKEFIESTGNNEFQSPNSVEGYYYNNVNCVKVISAGEGEVIRLRFLDHFHLEPDEKCQYDYLEVRDGLYGYSTHIATLCGTSPPTVIESSGRHLWLRFHSDPDITYAGFRAFVEFVPSPIARPDLDDCSFHLTSIDSYVKLEDLSEEVLQSRKELSIQHLDCTWLIEAPPNQKIYLQFLEFKLEKKNDCTFNFVEIYGSRTEYFGEDGIMRHYCGSEAESVQSNGNVLHLRFYTTLTNDNSEIGLGFKTKLEFYYNFYRDLTKVKGPDGKMVEPEPCKGPFEEFDCTDNTCVDWALTCNDISNCKQNNDEDAGLCKKDKSAFKMTMDLIVIAFIGCFLALGMCSGLFLNICRKLRQDKMELEEIRAGLHKSRDSVGNSLESKASKEEFKTVVETPKRVKSKGDVNESELLKNQNGSGENAEHNTPTTHSSSESKDTVVYRPTFSVNPEVLIGERGPYGFVKPKLIDDSIPYSPPPPYNPQIGKLKNVSVGEEVAPEPEEELHVIEVRDCACQTKESFTEKYLRDVYFGGPRYYTPRPNSASSVRSGQAAPEPPAPPVKRAPLARGEAVEMLEPVARKQLRRVPKGAADILMYPKSPGSVCSSVDASTGSLELLSELDEDLLARGAKFRGEEEDQESRIGNVNFNIRRGFRK